MEPTCWLARMDLKSFSTVIQAPPTHRRGGANVEVGGALETRSRSFSDVGHPSLQGATVWLCRKLMIMLSVI